MLRLNTEERGKSSFVDVYRLITTLLSIALQLKLSRNFPRKNELYCWIVFVLFCLAFFSLFIVVRHLITCFRVHNLSQLSVFSKTSGIGKEA